MATFWLTYKPLSAAAPRGWPSEQMDALVASFNADPLGTIPLWRIASTRAASAGDRFFLFKQGAGRRGIFGVGELIESPSEQADPTDIDAGPTNRARVRFSRLVNPAHTFLLDYELISDLIPKALIDAQQSGNRVPDEVADEIEKLLSKTSRMIVQLASVDADDLIFDPDSVGDERERALRAIRIRRGQVAFRNALMKVYGRRCAITGCSVEDVLEAAHIFPHYGRITNHVSNGLLLRADIHTLFDCGLIAIEPEARTVVVSGDLVGSSYAKLAGRKLRVPSDSASSASKRSLEWRYAEFLARASSLSPSLAVK